MSKSQVSFGWKIYFFFYVPLSVGSLVNVLSPSSAVYAYYHVLIAFREGYTSFYYCNILSAAIGIVCLVPLFLFVFQVRFLRPWVWRVLLLLRVIFDAAGHFYEFQFVKSLFYMDLWIAVLTVFTTLIVAIPSYIAHILYSFRKKIFSDSS